MKAEYENPGGTSKDRVARQIVEDAEDAGLLGPGGVIVEGSSGSTGISLALMAACRGYGCVVFMPDDQAQEKSDLLATLGATVRRVQPVSIVHPKHYVNQARATAAATPGGFFADQFENESNHAAHAATTGPEIWAQTGGRIHAFVMGAGTGGTIAGVSRYLKACDPGVKVILVDPPGSSLYHKVKHGVCFAEQQAEAKLRRHRRVSAWLAAVAAVMSPDLSVVCACSMCERVCVCVLLPSRVRYDTIIEGVGLDRLTANFSAALIDDAVRCTDEEAVAMSRSHSHPHSHSSRPPQAGTVCVCCICVCLCVHTCVQAPVAGGGSVCGQLLRHELCGGGEGGALTGPWSHHRHCPV